MKKIFRPLGAEVCEKRFIGDGEAVPEGWHPSTAAAKAAWRPQVKEKASKKPSARKPSSKKPSAKKNVPATR
jgi:hypothetical protein